MLGDSFGERLDYAIRSQYYTQAEIAEKVGVTQSTMSRYIRGHSLPTSEILAEIASTLHVSSDYLLGIDDELKDLAYVVLWLHTHAGELNDEQIKSIINELPDNKNNKDDAFERLYLATTMTEIRKILDSLCFTYEVLAPAHIRCYYPNSDDYTMISVCNIDRDKIDIAIGGKIIGSFDNLKNHLLNIRYYSS